MAGRLIAENSALACTNSRIGVTFITYSRGKTAVLPDPSRDRKGAISP
jgi:hypothetical protein